MLHSQADCVLQQFKIRVAETMLKREHRGNGCELLTPRMKITKAQVELRVKILQDLNGAPTQQSLHLLTPVVSVRQLTCPTLDRRSDILG